MDIATLSEPIRIDLESVERRMREWDLPADSILQAALSSLIDSGGKRIRPILSLLFGQYFSSPHKPLIELASGVEIIHTATLVHDDLIDNSSLRRGRPTLNTKWSPRLTILAGDFLFAWAARLAAETDSMEVMCSFSEAIMVLVRGEIAQHSKTADRFSLAGYESRIHAKTASLFQLACRGPAILSQQTDETIRIVSDFGKYLGMAFQIVDDILDFTGQTDQTGKPVAEDLQQGIWTLPLIFYSRFHPEDPDLSYLKAGELQSVSFERLWTSIRDSQAMQGAEDHARVCGQHALDALHRLPAGRMRQPLEEMVDFVVTRRS